MFKGSFKYSVDAKGRMSLPAKIREQVNKEANNKFVMTRGAARCIEIFPFDYWQMYIEPRLTALDQFDTEVPKFLRRYLQFMDDDTLDSQSRLLIPHNLIEYAGIEKEVLILGQVMKIEVWNPKEFDDYMAKQTEPYEEIARKVMTQS